MAYRTASQAEAEYISETGMPFIDLEEYDFMPVQLGTGLYTSNKPARWRATAEEWYCVIEADSKKLEEINKIWIPQTVPGREESLWYDQDEALLDYIESVLLADPWRALRFSYVSKYESELVMNIPIDAVNNNKVLDLSAKCWKTADELSEYKIVNWLEWDITGAPERVPVPVPAPES
ncbi:uncharacterized protein L3040_001931 [Drepanopeziza brunnea f. sp. 'multigermtubi']|nr:hypothetical protein L3040_001931 [Drepanopeziza brunnea f. sp. 'multigermtubi']